MATPYQATEADRYVLKPKCLPTYLVIDASTSMEGHQDVLNRTLAQVHASIRDHPRVAEFAQVSLIVFSTKAHLVIEMSNLDDVPVMPEVRCDGWTNYGAAFDLVRSRIETDVDELNAQGMAVLRPVVFLLTDGIPSDEGWQDAFRRLVDRRWKRYPHVITYGFGEASQEVLSKVNNGVGFIAEPGADQDRALIEALGSMLNSLVASSTAGTLQIPKQAPGYRAVEPDPEYLTMPREFLE